MALRSTGPRENTKQRQRRGAEMARAVILEAAAMQFARRGFHGTTIEEIAAAAAYSPAAIYKYFRNKEDLFGSLWGTTSDRVLSILREGREMVGPFAKRLEHVVSRLGGLLQDSPDLLVAYLAQGPHILQSPENGLERCAADQYMTIQRELDDLMEQGIQEGALRAEAPEDYSLLFMGLLRGFALRWITSSAEGEPQSGGAGGRRQFDIQTNTDRLIELFFRGAGRR
jgi:AcrR family transcriptional regulator